MEKLENDNGPYDVRTRLKTMSVAEALHVPDAPIKLRRSLKLFDGALGVRPGFSEYPDPDFVLHLLEGAGHQQIIRRQAGPQFKNLENFLRGSHATSPTTWKLILDAFDFDENSSDILRSLAHGQADGPLLPSYITMARAIEGLFLRMYRFATVGIFICECCGADKLDNARIWWPKQKIVLEPDAYNFVDRLLATLVGGAVNYERISSAESIDSDMLEALAYPDTHPIGNWMEIVRVARGLSVDFQLLSESVPDGRIRKWRSGQDLLPPHKAYEMISSAKSRSRLKQGLIAARTLALVIDVVQAAASTPDRPPRRAAQELISSRLKYLVQSVRLGLDKRFEKPSDSA